MTRSESLWQWTKCVSRNMPELTGSQARLLAWWSYGIALTGTCGRMTVATFLGLLCEEKVANIEQRLYEWCLDAADKSGGQRQALDLSVCQVALLRWILRLWVGTQLALTLDATRSRGSLCGAGGERGVPRHRHPGGLDSPARQHQRCLAG